MKEKGISYKPLILFIKDRLVKIGEPTILYENINLISFVDDLSDEDFSKFISILSIWFNLARGKSN
jgi:hypothetical protein